MPPHPPRSPILRDVIWVFSDLHARRDGTRATVEPRGVPGSLLGDAHHLDEWVSLIRAERGVFEEADLLPTWIACAGDLATTNQNQEIPRAFTFLRQLAETFDVDRRHVVVVPGNHDVALDAGGPGRLAVFDEQLRTSGFIGPSSPAIWENERDGLMIYPLDTNGLIGLSSTLPDDVVARLLAALPRGAVRFLLGLVDSSQVAAALQGVLGDGLRFSAGLVRPADATNRLTEFVERLRERCADRAFPIALAHHPLLPPAGRTADASPQDTTVLGPILRHRLALHGVNVVFQGHRHERSVHLEETLVGNETIRGSPTLAVSCPSLGYGDEFTVVTVERSADGAVRSVAGYAVGSAERERRSMAPRRLFARSWLSDRSLRCRLIRRVVALDPLGISDVDYYFHDIVPRTRSARRIEVPFRASTHCGVLVGNLQPRCLGADRGPRADPEFQHLRPPTPTAIDGSIVADVREGTESLTLAMRLTAVGSHATFREENELLIGRTGNTACEATTFVVEVATELYEAVVRFPRWELVPNADDVRVYVVAPDLLDGCRPLDVAMTRGSRVHSASVSSWAEARRLIVQVPFPLRGAAYVVSWGLPGFPLNQHERDAPGVWRSSGIYAAARDPRIATLKDGVLDLREDSAGALTKHESIRIAALRAVEATLLSGALAETLALFADDGAEVAVQVVESCLGDPDHDRSPCGIRTLAAVAPRQFLSNNARYLTRFRYGRGVAGVCARTGHLVRYSRNDRSGHANYDLADGDGPEHRHLVCMPFFLDGTRHPQVVLSIGLYADRLPRELTSDVSAASVIRSFCSAWNSQISARLTEARLTFHERPFDERDRPKV